MWPPFSISHWVLNLFTTGMASPWLCMSGPFTADFLTPNDKKFGDEDIDDHDDKKDPARTMSTTIIAIAQPFC